MAFVGFPSRPPRPTSCIYVSVSDGGPQCILQCMSGGFTPIPKATVAMSTRRELAGAVIETTMLSLTEV